MKLKNILCLTGACVSLAACAMKPTGSELNVMQTAIMPTAKMANAEARAFFQPKLIDPESSHYEFRPPVRGYTDFQVGDRMSGVFMCGTINSKNRMGGYTGQMPFVVHFNPQNPQVIDFGSVAELGIVQNYMQICQGLYGY